MTCIRRSILHPLDLKSNEVVKIKNADERVINLSQYLESMQKFESPRCGNSGAVEHKVGALNDLAVADILVGNDLFKSFKQLKDDIQIAAFVHVEENLQTEFRLEKSNLLEYVSTLFQSQDGDSSSAEILTQAEQVVLQSKNVGSSSAETLTQKEQVVVQLLDG